MLLVLTQQLLIARVIFQCRRTLGVVVRHIVVMCVVIIVARVPASLRIFQWKARMSFVIRWRLAICVVLMVMRFHVSAFMRSPIVIVRRSVSIDRLVVKIDEIRFQSVSAAAIFRVDFAMNFARRKRVIVVAVVHRWANVRVDAMFDAATAIVPGLRVWRRVCVTVRHSAHLIVHISGGRNLCVVRFDVRGQSIPIAVMPDRRPIYTIIRMAIKIICSATRLIQWMACEIWMLMVVRGNLCRRLMIML